MHRNWPMQVSSRDDLLARRGYLLDTVITKRHPQSSRFVAISIHQIGIDPPFEGVSAKVAQLCHLGSINQMRRPRIAAVPAKGTPPPAQKDSAVRNAAMGDSKATEKTQIAFM